MVGFIHSLQRKICGFLLFVSLVSVATDGTLAQGAPPLPDVNRVTDDNGVNIPNGKYPAQGEIVSIGSDSSGLSFQRNWEDVDADVWGHRYFSTIEITKAPGNIPVMAVVNLPDGGENFAYPSMVPFKKNGATLVENASGFVYTNPDGSVTTFDKYANQGLAGFALQTVRPSGETITYNWKNGIAASPPQVNRRVQSISSSFGYLVKLDYAGPTSPTLISATLINQAVDYCLPSADSCAGLSQTWPKMTYDVTP